MAINLTASSQSFPNLNFTQLTAQNGLSSNLVRCIFQDSRGLVWIGTDLGLNRYDGNSFKIFRNVPGDSTSICNNDIRQIVEDAQQHLWFSTAGGLCRFDPFTEKAISFYHDNKNNNSLSSDYEATPFVDSKKRLWLATYAGVQQFDYGRNVFTTYNMPALPTKDWMVSYNYFHHISEDVQHRLWAASNFGLYLVDEANHKLLPYYANELAANLSFYQSADNSCWIGQWGGGIKKFSADGNKWQKFEPFSKGICFGINEWKDNNTKNWLCAAMDGGLLLADQLNGNTRLYQYDKSDPQSLQANVVTGIMKDSDNRLWLGTDQGISIVDPALQHFRNIRLYHDLLTDNPRMMGNIRELMETGNNYFVAPWYNKGLYIYSKDWKFEKHIERIPPSSTSINSGAINFIIDDAQGNHWYGTDSGLVKQTGNNYKVFILPGSLSMLKGEYFVRNIIIRKDGRFWIRAPYNAVFLFDPQKEQFLARYRPVQLQPKDGITSMKADAAGNIWIGTEKGLFRLNETSGSFTSVPITSRLTGKEITAQVFDIFFDANATWFSTDHGVARIDASMKDASLVNESLAAEYGMCFKILPDSLGYLWITTSRGLLRYDKKNSFIFYNQLNGLPYDFFDGTALFTINRNGDYLMGALGIITVFNPAAFNNPDHSAALIFTDINSGRQRKQLDTAGNKRQIVLSPGETNLTVHFSLLNYTASVHNEYYYRLSGKDTSWYEAPNGNINFSNLQPGSYIMTAMGRNQNGLFDEVQQQLRIVVEPYWYQTLAFKIGCAVLLLLIVFLVYRWRIRAIRQEASFKQKIAETEMQALRAQMNPHFIFNSLNSIENFIMQNEKKLASDYLNKFSRLVRSILDSSRNEEVPVAKDMESLQLYIDLEQLRFSNKFSYEASIDPELLNGDYKVPSLLIQPYVENAIFHGIAHSDKKELNLKVAATLENGYIKYFVEDNGVGRKKAAAYNLMNRPNHKSVGLKITEERINLFNQKQNGAGEVQITDLIDELGEAAGTRVEIKIKAI